jgi:hypothetical protein
MMFWRKDHDLFCRASGDDMCRMLFTVNCEL